MTIRTAVTLQMKVEILELLGRCETPGQVGARFDLDAREVIDVAGNHGYPHPEKMLLAAGMIASRIAREAAAPAPVRATPTAPVPVAPGTGSHPVSLDTHADDSFVTGHTYGTYAVPARAHPMPERSLQRVALADLYPDPDNPREKLADIEELAASMEQVGQLTPCIARLVGDRLVFVAGHRRHAAAGLLGWDDLDVIVRADMPSDDVLLAMLAENGQRTDLDPIEEARAYRTQMRRLGLSARRVAVQVGRSEVYVSGRLALLELPVAQQELIRAGRLGIGDGIRAGRSRRSGGNTDQRTITPRHLGVAHPLYAATRARCTHSPRSATGVCGACWEFVIRADERALAVAAAGVSS